MTAIAANGSVTCIPVESGPKTLAPGVIQSSAGDVDRVLIDENGMRVVGKCSASAASIELRVVSAGMNIVSDSRNVHRGQTLLTGDLSVGEANGGAILDRGEFNLVHLGTGKTLNGSFYVLFTGTGCQFNVSAIGS
jgi:hypothetical protein